MGARLRYNSLQDFLISNPLSVDAQLDDGWGALFAVKGREIEAAILFADISSFSRRTLELSPTETLIFVNNFFAWITAEALKGRSAIVDKYIGDEIMVIFSEEFGSEDSFVDAVQTARWMAEYDVLDFRPHIGIASGVVTVGFVGTPLRYNCSVFGRPVVLAKRCASVKPQKRISASIIFPAELWAGHSFQEVFPRRKYRMPDGTVKEDPGKGWELLPPRKEEMRNMPETEIIEIAKLTVHVPTQSAEERAKEALSELRQAGRYTPRNTATAC